MCFASHSNMWVWGLLSTKPYVATGNRTHVGLSCTSTRDLNSGSFTNWATAAQHHQRCPTQGRKNDFRFVVFDTKSWRPCSWLTSSQPFFGFAAKLSVIVKLAPDEKKPVEAKKVTQIRFRASLVNRKAGACLVNMTKMLMRATFVAKW